ncbi:MAG: J domain-containing protein [Cyanobacteria bacterium P01_D01_bin.1]
MPDPTPNLPTPSVAERSRSHYDLLGLRSNASVQEIRRAYRDLSKLYHPDTTELESAIATRKFQALNEAYAVLSSPEKRISYDYKIGYSRLSVMQPLNSNRSDGLPPKSYDPTASAYLDPTDRPLSAGELFALFILGVTFIGCLLLVFTIGLTQSNPTA